MNCGLRRTLILRRAIISDIHGNLAALEAVLADIQTQKVDQILCLGDVIGYGPNPLECYKLTKAEASIILMGNHEQALYEDGGERFHQRAKAAINWTYRQFIETDEGQALLETIRLLDSSYTRGDVLCVHGSPLDPVEEYIMPQDAFQLKKMSYQWVLVKQIAFCGHTHLPGVFEENKRKFIPSYTIENGTYWLDANVKAIINVGSVGQPRDGNNKACYVILDETDVVFYRRVQYDLEKTLIRFQEVPELHFSLADRLKTGH